MQLMQSENLLDLVSHEGGTEEVDRTLLNLINKKVNESLLEKLAPSKTAVVRLSNILKGYYSEKTGDQDGLPTNRYALKLMVDTEGCRGASGNINFSDTSLPEGYGKGLYELLQEYVRTIFVKFLSNE